jgi:hypothetical protein
MAKSLEFWFRRKYNLAPTDPRFLDATLEQIEADFWAHEYANKPPGEEFEDEDFDLDEVMKQMEEPGPIPGAPNDPDDWGEPI